MLNSPFTVVRSTVVLLPELVQHLYHRQECKEDERISRRVYASACVPLAALAFAMLIQQQAKE